MFNFLSNFIKDIKSKLSLTNENNNSNNVSGISNSGNLNVGNNSVFANIDTINLKVESRAIIDEKLYSFFKEKVEYFLDKSKFFEAEKEIEEILINYNFKNSIDKINLYLMLGDIKLKISKINEAEQLIPEMENLSERNFDISKFKIKVFFSSGNKEKFQKEFEIIKKKFTLDSEYLNLIEIQRLFHVEKDFPAVIEYGLKNKIIEIFPENESFSYYIGISYMVLEDFKEAVKFLTLSNQLKTTPYKRYQILISEMFDLVNNDFSIVQENVFKTYYDNIVSLEEDIKARGDELYENYWHKRLFSTLQLNPEIGIVEVNNIPVRFKNTKDIKYMISEIYIRNQEFSKSIESLEDFKDSDELIFRQYLRSVYLNEEYQKVLDTLSALKNYKLGEYGDNLFGLNLSSIYRQRGFEAFINEINNNREFIFKSTYLLSIYIETLISEKKFDYLPEIIKGINEVTEKNDPYRFIISQKLLKVDLLEEAITLVKPSSGINNELDFYLVELFLISNNDDYLILGLEILEKMSLESKKAFRYFYFKAYINLRLSIYDESFSCFMEAFKIDESRIRKVETTKNILNLAITVHIQDLDYSVINFIKEQEDTIALMYLAIYYKRSGNYKEYVKYSSKSFNLLQDKFQKETYEIYLKSNYDVFHKEPDSSKTVDLEKIIILQNDSGNFEFICLYDDLFDDDSESYNFFNIRHLNKNSEIGLKLFKSDISDKKFDLFGEQYSIVQVIDREFYILRKCAEIYTDNYPDSYVMNQIELGDENSFKYFIPIIKILVKGNEHRDYLIKQYNFDNKIGLPFYAFSSYSWNKYASGIITILSEKNQPYFAGEINHLDLTDKKLVITFSTLVILSVINALEILENLAGKIIIPESLLLIVESLLNNAQEDKAKTIASLGLVNGNFASSETTKEEKESMIDLWRRIYQVCKKFQVVKDPDSEYSNLNRMNDICGKAEISSIKLAAKENAILISDDLFIRNIGHIFFQNFSSINTISILKTTMSKDLNKFLEKLVSLSKYNYCWLIDDKLLIEIINSIPIRLQGDGTPFGNISKIISNCLKRTIISKDLLNVFLRVKKILQSKTIFIDIPLYEVYFELIEKAEKEYKRNNYYIDK
ncbi:MAG: hypothetical protein U0354_19815 [Candidatus Sericytochromatia bacterium]